ncbi:helix-turn-helix domain-containing protein [Streptomyces enissocaesilis]|uniref:HTH cro/C1-type domain-containing protein n=1 Tax=Streptomyces enissocaesilis TaxID=332589 RepID=A0ABN3XQN2_9ACTN
MSFTRDPAAWSRLGEKIREAREVLGYSRKRLSEVAGVSEKSIQVAEEGRTPRARWPQSLTLIEEGLGWLPGSMLKVLDGEDPQRGLTQVPLFSVGSEGVTREPPRLSGGDIDLIQSGFVAQDMFVRQMKRLRKRLGLSPQDLVERAVDLGGDVDEQSITYLEDGRRSPKPEEADLLARALGTTVQELLYSAFGSGVDPALKAPPTEEELAAEAKAMERRIYDAGTQVNAATSAAADARLRAAAAQQAAAVAEAEMRTCMAKQRELETQYYYLLGRIDALRAAKGEQEIMEMRVEYREGRASTQS